MKTINNIFLWIFSIFIMLMSIIATYFSSIYINKKFGNPPVVRDLLWETLPYLNIFWLAEVIIIISLVLGLIFAVKKNVYLINYYIILVSTFHIIRAILIILTPLGLSCYSGIMPYGENSIFLYGAFPSGHLSTVFFLYLILHKRMFLLSTFLVGLIMLISHGHYSIDLIGTILLGYALFSLSEKHIRKRFEDRRAKQLNTNKIK